MIKRCDYCTWHKVYYDNGINDGCTCIHNIGNRENKDYHVCNEYEYNNSNKETKCLYFKLNQIFED